MTDFHGKTAVVTGAASGIGRATARALAEAGATVTLLDVNDELGTSAAAAAGGTYVHLDVSDPAAWADLLGGFDRLDLLHLNAGIYDTALADITEISDERYRALPRRQRRRRVLRPAGAIPLLERSRRCGGRHVVDGGGGAAAREPAVRDHQVRARSAWCGASTVSSKRRGIRINALCPGAVATPLMGEDPHAWFGERGIVAFEPEDLAATVVDLLGSDRSGEVVLHRPPWHRRRRSSSRGCPALAAVRATGPRSATRVGGRS